MDYSNIGYHFGVLNRRSQAYITHVCKPWNLSYSEYVILMELYQGDGCSQDELTQRLTADKGLVARTSKSLEAKGFIARRQDAVDKRLKRLSVLPPGERLRPTLQRILQCWMDALTADLSEEAVQTTSRCLEQAAQRAASVDVTKIYTEGKDTCDT